MKGFISVVRTAMGDQIYVMINDKGTAKLGDADVVADDRGDFEAFDLCDGIEPFDRCIGFRTQGAVEQVAEFSDSDEDWGACLSD